MICSKVSLLNSINQFAKISFSSLEKFLVLVIRGLRIYSSNSGNKYIVTRKHRKYSSYFIKLAL